MESYRSFLFAVVPLFAYVVSGTVKFAVNSLRYGKEAKRLAGNGGFPSTHTSIVSSVTVLIGLAEGWNSPMLGLGVALTCIVIIDALGIRRAVGVHAKRINRLGGELQSEEEKPLRERQGHSKMEVLGGLGVGTFVALAAYLAI